MACRRQCFALCALPFRGKGVTLQSVYYKQTFKMMKQTKIVASVSDRRCSVDFIRQLFDAGMNVVRMNTAHASAEAHKGDNKEHAQGFAPHRHTHRHQGARDTHNWRGCADRLSHGRRGKDIRTPGDGHRARHSQPVVCRLRPRHTRRRRHTLRRRVVGHEASLASTGLPS